MMQNPPKTTEQLLSEATNIEKMPQMQNMQYNHRRLMTHRTKFQSLSTDDLCETIRAGMWEELHFPSSEPQMSYITDIILAELQQ